MTPVRALIISIAWVGAGLFLRFRFRIIGCDEVDGGWGLAIYFFLTAAVVLWVDLREGAVGDEDDLAYRGLSRLTGFAALVIILSACLPYNSSQNACTS